MPLDIQPISSWVPESLSPLQEEFVRNIIKDQYFMREFCKAVNDIFPDHDVLFFRQVFSANFSKIHFPAFFLNARLFLISQPISARLTLQDRLTDILSESVFLSSNQFPAGLSLDATIHLSLLFLRKDDSTQEHLAAALKGDVLFSNSNNTNFVVRVGAKFGIILGKERPLYFDQWTPIKLNKKDSGVFRMERLSVDGTITGISYIDIEAWKVLTSDFERRSSLALSSNHEHAKYCLLSSKESFLFTSLHDGEAIIRAPLSESYNASYNGISTFVTSPCEVIDHWNSILIYWDKHAILLEKSFDKSNYTRAFEFIAKQEKTLILYDRINNQTIVFDVTTLEADKIYSWKVPEEIVMKLIASWISQVAVFDNSTTGWHIQVRKSDWTNIVVVNPDWLDKDAFESLRYFESSGELYLSFSERFFSLPDLEEVRKESLTLEMIPLNIKGRKWVELHKKWDGTLQIFERGQMLYEQFRILWVYTAINWEITLHLKNHREHRLVRFSTDRIILKSDEIFVPQSDSTLWKIPIMYALVVTKTVKGSETRYSVFNAETWKITVAHGGFFSTESIKHVSYQFKSADKYSYIFKITFDKGPVKVYYVYSGSFMEVRYWNVENEQDGDFQKEAAAG